jgi:hypothetical protein
LPLAPTIIVISDFKKEDQVERKTIEVKSDQPIEAEQSTNFLLKPV